MFKRCDIKVPCKLVRFKEYYIFIVLVKKKKKKKGTEISDVMKEDK